jgi:hypothetical protein
MGMLTPETRREPAKADRPSMLLAVPVNASLVLNRGRRGYLPS